MAKKKKIKAVGLLSGGLDSTLAVKLMIDQSIDVTVLNFYSPFCTCTRQGCRHEYGKDRSKIYFYRRSSWSEAYVST